jgi:tryptophanyl-tRNA synthetase
MKERTKIRKRILTGDRPTGPLHLGHYVGSLKNRVKLQNDYECFFIISDYQVLTDHLNETEKIEKNIEEVLLDYLSVGIDPNRSTIFIESQVPPIAELTIYLSMLVSLNEVQRNPTVKAEIKMAKEKRRISQVSFGFVGYPISQAADILIVRAHLVPVGKDQLPHIEFAREIARKFNRLFGKVFPLPRALLGDVPILPGLDGRKMSKSLGNAIYLSDSPQEVSQKVMKAVTDPARIHPTDKGHPQICNVFQYHKAFNANEWQEIEMYCKQGKIGCVECKKRLVKVLNAFLEPIREKRKYYEKRKNFLKDVLREGNRKTREEGEKTLNLVKEAMHFDYKNLL